MTDGCAKSCDAMTKQKIAVILSMNGDVPMDCGETLVATVMGEKAAGVAGEAKALLNSVDDSKASKPDTKKDEASNASSAAISFAALLASAMMLY